MCDLLDDNNFFIFDDESVRIYHVSKMPFRKKPRDSMNVRSKSNSNKSLPRTVHKWLPKLQPLAELVAKWFPRIVHICLWIIDSGCSKHMMGNRALLTNIVEKFLGTVRFGNNDFAVITGYGDVVIGSMTIKKVYYVKEKIINDLKDEVVSLLEKEKANFKTIESLKSKGFESSENAISESKNQSKNDCQVVEIECDNVKNQKIVQICLWIIDSGCLKHMTGNRALLTNFVEKFLGTVRFGNNDFAVIAGYGDVVIGSMTIKNVYYIEGLGHNLFSVGQFCDKGLEVAFRKSTCFVRNEDGVDLLTDHLCFACEQGKIHQKHHKSKTAFASNKPLYLLHMDLCGPMRVDSINGKRYMLVVVDDYSRYTWVFFRHSKDEASDVIISFIKKIQVNLQLQVQRVRTNNGTEFKNKTLAKFFDEVAGKNNPSVFFLHSKDEASEVIISFIKKTQVNLQLQVQRVRTDNGTEFKNKTLAKLFDEVGESSSSSLNDDVQQSLEEVILPSSNTQSIPINMIPNGDEASTSHNVFNERLEDAYFDSSTSFHDSSNVQTFY
nr:integrase, catalytic region, zinc finger, CCHC-type, peptidase aspartic, catalytic [Tanacetum cinerariifolium]